MKCTIERKKSRGSQKLTLKQLDEICTLLQQGTMTQVAIARMYHVSPPLIALIKKEGVSRYSERIAQYGS